MHDSERQLLIPGLISLAIVACSLTASAQDVLPVGKNPPPLAVPHFPDRLHAFVWRNWQLVSAKRLAQVLDTKPENVEAIASSMGLPPAGNARSQMLKRGYVTLIRRNWHLLPYDQLIVLLGKSSSELAHILREDDFLYIKLGRLKPKVEPLRYTEPDDKTRKRAVEIKQVVEQHFGDLSKVKAEPRFHFVEYLSALRLTDKRGNQKSIDRKAPLRMVYSYFGIFGDPLIDPELEPFPDGLLSRLAESGVNGIWMHVVLRQLAPGGKDFPEFGKGHQRRIETLKKLVAQAKRYGIGVYLYINEPRAMPKAFFKNRPEMAGVGDDEIRALCTSDPRVRKWLSNSLAHVFSKVPDLGGVFTITASENLTNCASHHQHQKCPRCRERTDEQIIAEVNAAIEEGVHRGNPAARVVVWDWGWKRHGDASEMIGLLPRNIELMSVSEWSLPIERGGVKAKVGEYSMSAVGPGPRAKKHWQQAQKTGLKTVAKIAVNNTWELSAVPFIPVMDLIAEHCANLSGMDVDGLMLSWTLGGYPSPNLMIAQRFADDHKASPETVLNSIAQKRYGERAAPHIRRAWTAFSNAFRQFPYGGSVLYKAPQQMGPANLFYAKPTGYEATMVGFPYDDLKRWRGPYPATVFAGQFEKVAGGWAEGLKHFQRAVDVSPDEFRDVAASDLIVARAAYLHFASVANQVRFVLARDALRESDLTDAEKKRLQERIQKMIEIEIKLARDLFAVSCQDSRIGYEASNHYYYVPQDLIEKVINCCYLADQWGD